MVLLGVTSLVAPFLPRRLAAQGRTGVCLSRGEPGPAQRPLPPGFRHQTYDPDGSAPLAPPGAAVLSLAPLWALPPLLPRLGLGTGGAARLVALGSTSATVKADSGHEADRRVAAALDNAEAALRAQGGAGEGRPAWTVLRPTLIHDGETDGTVTAAARMIARFGAVPVQAPALGLRQPVHADEVAAALLAALDAPPSAVAGRAFDLPGGETLTYRAMLERIAAALGRRLRLVPLPAPLLTLGLWAAHRAGRPLSPSVFARMNRDQIFDAGPARAAFGYAPGPFRPVFPWARLPSRTPASQARP